MMNAQNITVNGRPLVEFLGREKSQEVSSIYRDELRGRRRMIRRPIVTRQLNPVTGEHGLVYRPS